MEPIDAVVVLAGVAVIAFLGWFFFGPKKARRAEVVEGVQEVDITVRGGYSPDLIRVRQGVPLRLVFHRQEAGWSSPIWGYPRLCRPSAPPRCNSRPRRPANSALPAE